ncbi:MAG: hypothetical protein HYZ14_13235 [Bacteroidetes bacterium]|nr:hypothetical protein [Bacteroidota bacterium]
MTRPIEKWLAVLIRLCIPFLIIGFMFKIMHWPGAKAILVSTLTLLSIFSILAFGVTRARKTTDYIKLFLRLSFAAYLILQTLHWPGKIGAGIVLLASFAMWIWYDGFALNKGIGNQNSGIRKKIPNTLLIVGGLTTLIGILLKIMHWPGAGIMLIFGIGCVAVSFFSGALNDE